LRAVEVHRAVRRQPHAAHRDRCTARQVGPRVRTRACRPTTAGLRCREGRELAGRLNRATAHKRRPSALRLCGRARSLGPAVPATMVMQPNHWEAKGVS
jgi:hypothetical protein